MEATIGGTRRHLVDVARGQAARGMRVTVVASDLRDPGFPAELDALEAEGVGVVRLPMVREIAPRKDLAHLRRIKDLLRDVRPDVVHTHSSKAGVLGRRASLSADVGVRVHTPHTFAFLFEALFGRAKRAVFRSIERGLARSTHRMVAVSTGEAETITRSGVVAEDRVRVVCNGIDPGRIEGAEPVDVGRFGLDPSLPIACVIGLVYRAKGQDLAVEALASSELRGLQLLFVGPGDSSELAARARTLGVHERAVFVGPRDDVPSILAAADFLVLPSRWEGLPYVVLEAMAASRAVVATPVDGATDLVLDDVTGYLAESVSASSIGHAMERALLAGAARRAQLGAAGRERLDSSFTIDAMLDGLDGVYREAIEEAARGTTARR